MLSDHEQRALEELERHYATDAREAVRPGPAPRRRARRMHRPSGRGVLVLVGSLSVLLLVVGVPVAALALMLATAVVWLFWRLVSVRWNGGIAPPAAAGVQPGRGGRQGRPGDLIRRYLRWLAEVD